MNIMYNTKSLSDQQYFNLLGFVDILTPTVATAVKNDERYEDHHKDMTSILLNGKTDRELVEYVYANPETSDEILDSLKKIDEYVSSKVSPDMKQSYYKIVVETLVHKLELHREIRFLKLGIDDNAVKSIYNINSTLNFYTAFKDPMDIWSWETQYLKLLINMKMTFPYKMTSKLMDALSFYENYIFFIANGLYDTIKNSFLKDIRNKGMDFIELVDLLSTLEVEEKPVMEDVGITSSSDGRPFSFFGDADVMIDYDEFDSMLLSVNYENLKSFFHCTVVQPSKEIMSRLVAEGEKILMATNNSSHEAYFIIQHDNGLYAAVSLESKPGILYLVNIDGRETRDVIMLDFSKDLGKFEPVLECDIDEESEE